MSKLSAVCSCVLGSMIKIAFKRMNSFGFKEDSPSTAIDWSYRITRKKTPHQSKISNKNCKNGCHI